MISLVAGVLTVLVILLSQSLYFPSGPSIKKEKQKTEQHGLTIINAPADVVPTPSVQLNEGLPALLKPVIAAEENSEPFFTPVEILRPYLKILFRAIISPNAP